MGWYPRNTDEMTQTFDTLVGRQLVGHPETTMLITSMSGVGNGADVLNVLSSLTDFKGNGAASDKVGIFVASNEVTALDALRQVEQGAARFMQAAIESLCYVEIPGQSVQVKFPGVGKTWVDLKKFASLTGTAEAATGETFSAYVHVTPEPKDATQNRFVFVAIKGAFHASGECNEEAADTAISAYLEAAAQKAKYGFDTVGYADIPGMKDGWQLRVHPKFKDIVRSVRGGYSLSVETTATGICIRY